MWSSMRRVTGIWEDATQSRFFSSPLCAKISRAGSDGPEDPGGVRPLREGPFTVDRDGTRAVRGLSVAVRCGCATAPRRPREEVADPPRRRRAGCRAPDDAPRFLSVERPDPRSVSKSGPGRSLPEDRVQLDRPPPAEENFEQEQGQAERNDEQERGQEEEGPNWVYAKGVCDVPGRLVLQDVIEKVGRKPHAVQEAVNPPVRVLLERKMARLLDRESPLLEECPQGFLAEVPVMPRHVEVKPLASAAL